jgi:hypothetical protein
MADTGLLGDFALAGNGIENVIPLSNPSLNQRHDMFKLLPARHP